MLSDFIRMGGRPTQFVLSLGASRDHERLWELIRGVVAEVLTDDGHDVTAVGSGEEGLSAFQEEPYPIVVTDVRLGGMSGIGSR